MARDPLDKVRKLLALAGSSNVHEPAAAAARAQAIIERYRLEDLLEAEESAPAVPVEEEVLELSRRLRRWKTVLAAALADVNGCLVATREEGRERRIVLVGRAPDRAAVRSLWDWLVPQLEWLSATHGAGKDKRWHDDFRIGAAEVVGARLREAQQEGRGGVEPAALVRLEPALAARQVALERYARERMRTRPGRRLMVGVDAWRAGRAAGATLPLGDED
jgi:hypothetical protein